ncbi:helix-turn-helix transcriptional regulator [Metasolibacillus meyeri]|uniref:Helix-turn-helix transcriptional regulator n=1 Tax=Metasolibacillus meyeri TaxID=1071052 RepID=A0AAW9NR24_9BACL|nr:helix-turn-helix transcriptional regulator [Metasolibacillus meyeri]MEC1177303.1 helix-turn-helix transcriptional regulator [Metasolibacillus meyeri]
MRFRLQEVREAKGISRYQLSKLAGVNESTLQMIENSEDPNPTFKTMCKLADALGVKLDDLRY